MSDTLHFYYDVSSPYSYLAFARIADVASAHGVSLKYHPFLLGGVLMATKNQMPTANPARAAYLLKDLERCARRDGIPFKFSSTFPHNSLLAMRCITAAAECDRLNIATTIFQAAWVNNLNISKRPVLEHVLRTTPHLLDEASDPAVKLQLRETTENAVKFGAFGAPFFRVGDADYWGNDRLEMAVVRAASDE